MIHVQTKWVSVVAFTIAPDQLPGFARESEMLMRRCVPACRGFMEGLVMVNEDKTRMLIVTQWESREAWIAAEWNEAVSGSLADMVESAKGFEYFAYEPITVVRPQ
jgi:hypothetical protein